MMTVSVLWDEDNNYYVAQCPRFGLRMTGQTPGQVVQDLGTAIELYMGICATT